MVAASPLQRAHCKGGSVSDGWCLGVLALPVGAFLCGGRARLSGWGAASLPLVLGVCCPCAPSGLAVLRAVGCLAASCSGLSAALARRRVWPSFGVQSGLVARCSGLGAGAFPAGLLNRHGQPPKPPLPSPCAPSRPALLHPSVRPAPRCSGQQTAPVRVRVQPPSSPQSVQPLGAQVSTHPTPRAGLQLPHPFSRSRPPQRKAPSGRASTPKHQPSESRRAHSAKGMQPPPKPTPKRHQRAP